MFVPRCALQERYGHMQTCPVFYSLGKADFFHYLQQQLYIIDEKLKLFVFHFSTSPYSYIVALSVFFYSLWSVTNNWRIFLMMSKCRYNLPQTDRFCLTYLTKVFMDKIRSSPLVIKDAQRDCFDWESLFKHFTMIFFLILTLSLLWIQCK